MRDPDLLDGLDLDSLLANKIDLSDLEDGTSTSIDVEAADAASLARMLHMLKTYNEQLEIGGTAKWFVPGTPFEIDACPKHKLFFQAGATYNERLFMAANRSGKSVAGAYETACHATGDYPEWWTGKRFSHPVDGWVVGPTARHTRDTVQKELLGPSGAWGTGMIPASKLGKYFALAGVPQGVDVIRVKHKSGGWSRIGFKNYEQNVDSFQGTALHFVWGDEEMPQAIYNECLLRTMTTGGLIYLTFTPLKGLTPLVVRYAEKADFLGGAKSFTTFVPEKDDEEEEGEEALLANHQSYKAIIQATWDDAPWLTEEAKERMDADTPPHLRDARRKGIPAIGSGNVYPLDLEHILCKPFEIPRYFKRMYALDVGWNKTAVLFAALDPQTDTLYIYDEYYVGQQPPAVHAAAIRSRGEWIPGVIDPASRGRSQHDGTQLIRSYYDLGLKLKPANNEVESGIQNAWHRMTAGKIKVFSTLTNFQKEYTLYRRDLNGKIIKENDHLMDCLRYLCNNLIRAVSLDQVARPRHMKGALKYDV